MILSKLIVHGLKKESGSTDVTLIRSNQLIPVDVKSESLVTSLLKSYNGDRILYGVYDSSPGRYFPSRFNNYVGSTRSDAEFINFTVDSLGNLESFIQSKILATGGYLLFAEYEQNEANFISIFLIRDTEGQFLDRIEGSYKITSIQYLDTSHLAMACRINESKIRDGESNYLSFTRLRQQDVSDYFLNWISVERLESSTEFTNALYNIVNNVELPINNDTGTHYTIDEVRNMVYSNAMSNPQGNINIRLLSEHIYGDPEIIINYAEQNGISIDTEFRFNKTVIKKFIQVGVNADGIRMKFSRGDIGTKVRFSDENPNQIIIESEKFVSSFKHELEFNA